ncbi:MAG: hypothetical protein H6728_12230 [Myxococcales bacterium]|nr:hypothetical protein [Myxococcales bacterium]MCB9643833.1 hypothetical protein [Myxococcales bacterium]
MYLWPWEKIPDHILHNFACDCAERALSRSKRLAMIPDPRSVEALRYKRLFIEGRCSEQALRYAFYAAQDAARSSYKGVRDAGYAAMNAALIDPRESSYAVSRDAICDASRHGLRQEEIVWQVEHMNRLLTEYMHKRESLLLLLRKRKVQQHDGTLQRYQSHLEEALF